MRRFLLVLLLVGGCGHDERTGTTAGESVPRPPIVIQNAIPNDMPPATPPIPPTSRSAQNTGLDGGNIRMLTITPLAPPLPPKGSPPSVDAGFFTIPASPPPRPLAADAGAVSPQR